MWRTRIHGTHKQKGKRFQQRSCRVKSIVLSGKINYHHLSFRYRTLTSEQIAQLEPNIRKQYFSWAYANRQPSNDWLPPFSSNDPFLTWNPPYLIHRMDRAEYLDKLLTEHTIGINGASFSESEGSNVPFHGVIIELDKQALINKGVKPLWYSENAKPNAIQKFYGKNEYYWDSGTGYRREYEWHYPHRLQIDVNDIKAIWIGGASLNLTFEMSLGTTPENIVKKQLKANMRLRSLVEKKVKSAGLNIPVRQAYTNFYYHHFKEDREVHQIDTMLTSTQWEQRNLSRFVNLSLIPKLMLEVAA